MSNRLQFDPVLVRGLASELDARLRGRGCTAAPFFTPDLSVTLPLNGQEILRADLHPERGWIRILPTSEDFVDELDAVCTRVWAPNDERIILIEMEVTGRFQHQFRTIALELQTNQWNAVVFDTGDRRIVNVLRGRRAGDRSLFPGAGYELPSAPPRYGAVDFSESDAAEVWKERIAAAPPEARLGALIGGFAYTGSINGRWILDAAEPESALNRWLWIRSMPVADPRLLLLPGRIQPYPLALAGIEADPAGSLLDAMAKVATSEPQEVIETAAVTAAAILARESLASINRKLEGLRREIANFGEATRIRTLGDLLLSNLHQIPRGQANVVLEDWEGNAREIALDPALTPAENAARYYDKARRKKRAEEQIPALLATAERSAARWRQAAESIDRGDVPDWVADQLRGSAVRETRNSDAPVITPYRTFKTSGGLEVRVGRNSRENDHLTFRQSSPNDVWLHAQSVPGSHVILRWQDPASPPARDLEEAALLAAHYSSARNSSLVAVAWTRRKQVRKPRGAAPGLVIPQQTKTVLVKPEEGVEERLRWPRES